MSSISHYLYLTTNTVNGDFYVGIRSCFGDPVVDTYLGSGIRLKASIGKYGKDVFKKKILNFFESRDQALMAEGVVVDDDFLKLPGCLNLTKGGKGNYRAYRAERSIRISKALTGKQKTAEHKAKIALGRTGKKHSLDTLAKMKANHPANRVAA